jgi:hypothetical protein
LGQVTFERLIKRVANLFDISPKELLSGGKHTKTVKARSVDCYWGNRELGMSTLELSKKKEYIPADSESIRGARSENRPHGKAGASALTKPIIQCPLTPFLRCYDLKLFFTQVAA